MNQAVYFNQAVFWLIVLAVFTVAVFLIKKLANRFGKKVSLDQAEYIFFGFILLAALVAAAFLS